MINITRLRTLQLFKKILIGFLVIIVLAFGFGIYQTVSLRQKFINRLTGGLKVTNLELVDEVQASEIKAEYELIEGWNLVAFPIRPVNFNMASGLVLDVAKKGGYVTVVSVWDGDRWQEFVQRGKDSFGEDFEILPGKAYFLRNEKQVNWQVIGEPVQPRELAEYKLEKGWNTIGLVKEDLQAKKVIDQINQGQEKATVIDWWTMAGNWELFVKRIYSAEDIQEYGENFDINKETGYMVFVKEPVVWRVQ